MKKLLIVSLVLNAITALMLALLLWQVHGLMKNADDAFGKVDDVAREVESAARLLKSQGVYDDDDPDGGLVVRENPWERR